MMTERFFSASKLYDVTPKSQLQDSRLAYSPTDGVKKRSHFVASKSSKPMVIAPELATG